MLYSVDVYKDFTLVYRGCYPSVGNGLLLFQQQQQHFKNIKVTFLAGLELGKENFSNTVSAWQKT